MSSQHDAEGSHAVMSKSRLASSLIRAHVYHGGEASMEDRLLGTPKPLHAGFLYPVGGGLAVSLAGDLLISSVTSSSSKSKVSFMAPRSILNTSPFAAIVSTTSLFRNGQSLSYSIARIIVLFREGGWKCLLRYCPIHSNFVITHLLKRRPSCKPLPLSKSLSLCIPAGSLPKRMNCTPTCRLSFLFSSRTSIIFWMGSTRSERS